MNKRWLASRRAALGMLGAGGLSAVLPGRGARAVALAPQPRLIVIHVPEGMWKTAQRPVVGATTLGPLFSALDPLRSQLTVIENLNMKSRPNGPGGDGHHRGVPHMFTCTEMADVNNAGGASVDQKIAQAIGTTSKFASLQFAVRIVYGDTNSKPIWSAPSRVVPAEQSPWTAYTRLFGGAMAPSATTTAGAPVSGLDLKKSAMDYALADMASLGPKLSVSDRQRLISYQDSLRSIETRLATVAPPMATGGACMPPVLGATIDKAAEANYPTIGALQMDLIVAALQCGLTRVASLQWGNSNDQCTYSWLGINKLGHDLSHNNGNCDPTGSKKTQVTQWYAQQYAYLLNKLKAIPEGTGTMLDNTVVLWASEFSETNSHACDSLLWILGGNAGGYFTQGKVVDVGGKSVNDLHTSICNAFGITDKTFGNPAYCAGPLTALHA